LYEGFPAYSPHLYIYIYWPLASWEYKLLIPNSSFQIIYRGKLSLSLSGGIKGKFVLAGK
jgi:hypothetical protein